MPLPSCCVVLPVLTGSPHPWKLSVGDMLSRPLGYWSKTFTQGKGQVCVGVVKSMSSEVRLPVIY